MISTQQVIDRLLSEPTTSSYTVSKVKHKELNLIPKLELPSIFVGYARIRPKSYTDILELDILRTHGEDLIQTIEIQIACEEKDFDTIWKNVYKSLNGWNPNELEKVHTTLTFLQGGVMGIENERLWNVDYWNIGFPTVEVDL